MKKSEISGLLKKAGDLNSLYGIKDIVYNSGRARGVHAYEVKNGKDLNLTVFLDRGMDIPMLEYKGRNMGLMTKSGISSPYSYRFTPDGLDSFLRQFTGGFLTTCGITYSGAPSEEGGKFFPLHGATSNTVAENTYALQETEGDEIVLKICGEVREACLFSENMLLRREMKVYTETNRIKIHDVVENRGFKKSPVLIIYHVNFGYPMLDAGARLYFSGSKVDPQTEFARDGLEKYWFIEEPEDCREEQCYYHTGQKDPEHSFAMIHNEKIGLAAIVKYNSRQCPVMCEWKSMQSGDYALGLEPTTGGTHGRVSARKDGWLRELNGQESCEFDLEFVFTDDPQEIKKTAEKCKENKF